MQHSEWSLTYLASIVTVLPLSSLDDKEIEIEVAGVNIGVEIMAPPGMEEMTNQLQSMFQNLGGQKN
ncbi:hypothetical protein GASC598B02_000520 [Gilliamella apicola SCGC AB-598-B02]|nr:hypothetical protein GASC598B02_000520 [Gilliamella apicola SCGC AB-598-B02]